jgi:hypothetical protein
VQSATRVQKPLGVQSCFAAVQKDSFYRTEIIMNYPEILILKTTYTTETARLCRFLSPFHYESGPFLLRFYYASGRAERVRLQSEEGKERGTPHPYIFKVNFYIASRIYLLHLEILSKASAVHSWVPKAVKRTYPSPLGPKPQPGVQTTCAP